MRVDDKLISLIFSFGSVVITEVDHFKLSHRSQIWYSKSNLVLVRFYTDSSPHSPVCARGPTEERPGVWPKGDTGMGAGESKEGDGTIDDSLPKLQRAWDHEVTDTFLCNETAWQCSVPPLY